MESGNIDHIYRDGRRYDCLFGEPCMPFWIEMAKQSGGVLLELGCGTGKITIPLAEAGFEVVGLDNSESMLMYAREKASTGGRNLSVRLVHADMKEFLLGEEFDMIMLPSNNLCHLLSLQEAEECFKNVADHLSFDGIFVIDVFVPDTNLLAQDSDQENLMAEYDDPDGRGKVTVSYTSQYDSVTQIKRSITREKISGCSDKTGQLNMRMFFPKELEELLQRSGFSIEAHFGDYERTPFSDDSSKQILIARKQQ